MRASVTNILWASPFQRGLHKDKNFWISIQNHEKSTEVHSKLLYTKLVTKKNVLSMNVYCNSHFVQSNLYWERFAWKKLKTSTAASLFSISQEEDRRKKTEFNSHGA
jgi:hypothetical protein